MRGSSSPTKSLLEVGFNSTVFHTMKFKMKLQKHIFLLFSDRVVKTWKLVRFATIWGLFSSMVHEVSPCQIRTIFKGLVAHFYRKETKIKAKFINMGFPSRGFLQQTVRKMLAHLATLQQLCCCWHLVFLTIGSLRLSCSTSLLRSHLAS